jgi:hypothetical protein
MGNVEIIVLSILKLHHHIEQDGVAVRLQTCILKLFSNFGRNIGYPGSSLSWFYVVSPDKYRGSTSVGYDHFDARQSHNINHKISYGIFLRTTGWKVRIRFPAVKAFSLLHRVHTVSGAQLVSYSMLTGGSFPEVKAGRDVKLTTHLI